MSRRNRIHSCHLCGGPMVKTGSKQARMVDVIRDADGWVTVAEVAMETDSTYDAVRRLVSRIGWTLERRKRLTGHGSYEYRWVGD